jgi:hypothetical protein
MLTLTMLLAMQPGKAVGSSIDQLGKRMRELLVSTQTSPVELAAMFNDLVPNDEIGGRQGADGALILYACGDGHSPAQSVNGRAAITARVAQSVNGRAAITARVAIDVVLQHVEGMPGAQSLVANVREQLAGAATAKAGWLAPPLTVLARLYSKTISAMPGRTEPGHMLPRLACGDIDDDAVEQQLLTPEQRQALENLLGRLMELPYPSKQPDRR